MQFEEIDLYEKLDGIVAPSKYALEGYFDGNSPVRARLDHLLINKFHSVVTGVNLKAASRQENYRTHINPFGKKYIVGYFGRFNEQKGFDRYLKLVKALEKETNIQFVCAGAGGIEVGSDNYKNLNNLGWIADDIAEYMASVDLIVAPNRVCYFDLAILESLSLGTPVVASAVGGNKYFSRFAEGVYLFESDVDLAETVLATLSNLPARAVVQTMYNENFSTERFYDNHQQLAIDLLNQP
ncbi:glycosyltransferase family 4 protein [Deinococcus malanensis]